MGEYGLVERFVHALMRWNGVDEMERKLLVEHWTRNTSDTTNISLPTT
jgi:hypothetical protein